jgi:hypothetical protein
VATNDIERQVLSIVRDWANLPTEPQRTDVLQNLWANALRGPFVLGAQDLAQRLNSQIGSNILSTDITAATTINDLIVMYYREPDLQDKPRTGDKPRPKP